MLRVTCFRLTRLANRSHASSASAGKSCASPLPVAESGLSPLLAALQAVTDWLRHCQTAGTIVGGVAASVLGRPRLTRDIDALISADESRWPMLLREAARFGLGPRIDDPLSFAAKARVLLLRHEASAIDVDIILGALPIEAAIIERAVATNVGSLTLPLPQPADLILMKAIAGRPRDMEDIEAIVCAHPAVDLSETRNTLVEFAAALGSSELVTQFDSVVGRTRRS